MVDIKILTPEEKDWLNNYNAECLNKVAPLLKIDSLGYNWLKNECKTI